MHSDLSHLVNVNFPKLIPSSTNFLYPATIQNPERHSPILKNNLLYPSREIKKSLPLWADQLTTQLHQCRVHQYRSKKIHSSKEARLADIYHQAGYIFVAIADYSAAREIFYSQIQFFLNAQKPSNNFSQDIIQPWIDLSYMDAREGNIHSAISKISMINHCLLDPVKIYLRGQCYTSLLAFLQKKTEQIEKTQAYFVCEAKIIALANTGNVEAAILALQQALRDVPNELIPIYKLRECELACHLGLLDKQMVQLLRLSEIAKRLLINKNCTVAHILFGLHAAYVLALANQAKLAAELSYFCLERAVMLQDEILQTKALISLYHLIESEGKSLVENLMIALYCRTYYVEARTALLNTFPDLKYVECGSYPPILTVLFEELTTFSFF